MKGIQQHDVRDCGLACLATIFRYYQYKVPMTYLREMSRIDKSGISLFELVNISQKNRFEAEVLKGNVQEFLDEIYNNINLPCIVHIKTEENLFHYIVIWSMSKNTLKCFDPAKGSVKYTVNEFANVWTGYVIFIRPTDELQKADLTKNSYNKYLKIVVGLKKYLLFVLILSVLISLLSIMISFSYQQLIDNYLTDKNVFYAGTKNILEQILGDIKTLFIVFASMSILEILLNILRGRIAVFMAKKVDNELINLYFNKLKQLPYKFFQDRDTGEILSRFQDISEIRTFVSESGVLVIIDLGMAAICGVILYYINSFLFAIILAVLIIYALIVLLFGKEVKRRSIESKENYTKVVSWLKEVVSGIETLKLFDNKNVCSKKFKFLKEKMLQSNYRIGCLSINLNSLLSGIETLGSVGVLCLGGFLITNGEITLGMLMSFEALMTFFMEPVKELIGLLPDIQKSIVIFDRMNDIVDARTEAEQRKGECTKKNNWNSIEIKHLSFAYRDGQYVLENVNMNFMKGTMTAITGKSGSGKSTLARILLGMEQIEDNMVVVDNVDLNKLSLEEIRENVVYVAQKIFLFNNSISENIFLGSVIQEESIIAEILQGCGIQEMLKNIPGGMNCIVGEEGDNLSGGQKQRIAIARALLKNPKVLILDEALNQLEECASQKIISFIRKKFADIIIIMITHDSRISGMCDNCVDLK